MSDEPRHVDETGGLLAPYRVLDLTDRYGWLCGRILGDLGADVIKGEPPGGDPGRRSGDVDFSWCTYNASKRGITLSLERPGGQDLLRRLVAQADFLIESTPPGFLDDRGLGYRPLSEVNPRLIVTSITPFGLTGPYAHYRGSDLIAMAMSGLMSLVGEPGRPPLRVSLPQAAMWTGMYAAAGTLVAHHYRQTTGRGQHVDVSMQASLLWALANAPPHWSMGHDDLRRAGNQIVGRSISGARMRAIYPCRDGHINFIIYGGEAGRRSNEAMVQWMAESGDVPQWLLAKDWAAFNVATSPPEEIEAIEEPFAEFLMTRTKAEFAAESVRRGLLGYPVADVMDIREDPQLGARAFWQDIEHPELDTTITYPGAFAKFSAGSCAIRGRAPRVGEHNTEIYAGELALSRHELESLRQEGVI